MKFEYTSEGYLEAQSWLKEIGEWEYINTHGFNTDGWSITQTANVKWEQLNGN